MDLIKYAIIACSVLGIEIQVEIIGYSLLLESCIIQAQERNITVLSLSPVSEGPFILEFLVC